MNHVVILETAHHVGDGVSLADVRQKLVAQPLAPGRAGHQPGDVHEFDSGGDDLLRLDDGGQRVQPGVGHRHHPDVGVDGAERIIFGLDAGLGEGVEQSGLADVRQTDDAALDTHGCSLQEEPAEADEGESTRRLCKA